jgi:hypothetical protein
MSKSDHHLGEGPGLGQGPGLLGYGFKYPDRTIGVQIPTGHRAKFQLSRCNSDQNRGDRRTEWTKMCSKNTDLRKSISKLEFRVLMCFNKRCVLVIAKKWYTQNFKILKFLEQYFKFSKNQILN